MTDLMDVKPRLCTSPGSWSVTSTPTEAKPPCPLLYSRLSKYVRDARQRAGLCCTEGAQQELMRTLQWASCDGQMLRPASVLLGARPLTVGLMGDSTMSQIFEALLFDLYESGTPLTYIERSGEEEKRPELYATDAACTVRPGAQPRRGGSKVSLVLQRGASCTATRYSQRAPHWEKCLHLPAVELRLGPEPPETEVDTRSALRFWRIDKDDNGPKLCPNATFFTQRMQAVLRGSDVTFFNVGLHYNHERSEYETTLRTMLKAIATHRRSFFMHTFPQHFHSRSGSGLWGDFLADGPRTGACIPGCINATRRQWRNAMLERVAADVGLSDRLVRIDHILRPLHLLHRPRTSRCAGQDCTHYCFHPRLWSPVLDLLLRSVVNAQSHVEPSP